MIPMNDIAVRVENLGKLYRIGQFAGYKTIRETMTNVMSGPLRRFRHPSQESRSTLSATSHQPNSIWALKNVSFEVKRGEAVGIIGRNGSGKSTLLKILSRITAPTEGHAEIHGRVGSLLEVGTGFHPELTGRENIYLNGAVLGMRKAEVERKFDEISAFAEIEKFLDTPVKRYSSGMYVRLAFAVAAHLEPEILVVDEVLAVGDAQFQKKCLGKMSNVASEGRTVLFVSHNMAAVQRLCSRSVLLESGRLDFQGASHEVVQQYLGYDQRGQAVSFWEDLERAPGNELARLHAVRILNASGAVTPEIRTDQDFLIQVTYYVKKDGLRPGATAILFNQEGTCIFSSVSNHEERWHEKPHPIGLYRSSCRVPKSLLSDGEYRLTVILWEGYYQLICREDNVASLRVVDAGEVRGDYTGSWEGVIRPSLQWETERITGSDT